MSKAAMLVHLGGGTSKAYIKANDQSGASSVPEPEVYAMMLAGLSLVGFAARRKQA